MALSAPQQDGDRLNPVDINGHTMIICPTEFIPHIQTVNTKAGEQSPAIRVNVAVLSQVDESNQVPIYRGALWFNVKLYGNLKRQIGETILGRMEQGQGNPGQNPPWQLADIMSEQTWVDYANQWLETPEGKAFEAEAQKAVQLAQAAAATPPPAAPVAAPSPTPAPAPRSAPPPAVPPSFAAPAAPSAPAAAPVAVQAGPPPAPIAPAGDLASMLGGLPPEEQAKMLALLQQQQQASS